MKAASSPRLLSPAVLPARTRMCFVTCKTDVNSDKEMPKATSLGLMQYSIVSQFRVPCRTSVTSDSRSSAASSMPPIWLYTNRLDSSTARLKICVEYCPVCSAHHHRVNVECKLAMSDTTDMVLVKTVQQVCAPGRRRQCPRCPEAPGDT